MPIRRRYASLALAGACLLGFVAPAAATITYTVSAPLTAPPPTPSGSVVLENFAGTTYSGVTENSRYNNYNSNNISGTGQTDCTPGTSAPGSSCSTGILSSGTNAFPAPAGATRFLALSTVPISVFNFPTGYSPAAGGVGFFELFLPSNITSVSFYTGNVSAYAAVDILYGSTAAVFSSTTLGIADSPDSYELTFNWSPSDDVKAIELILGYNTADGQYSGGIYHADGFDVTDFTGTLAAVPEPSSLALLAAAAALMFRLAPRGRKVKA